LLHPHLLEPYVVLNPVTAQALKIANGAAVLITVNGSTFRIAARLDETTPRGIVLAPRSMGMSLHEPMRLKIEIVK
jgi:anaerobic selenocysteine-containing dehydrogenase